MDTHMAWFQAGRGGGVTLCYKPVSGSPASHPPFLLPALSPFLSIVYLECRISGTLLGTGVTVGNNMPVLAFALPIMTYL